MNLPKNIVIYGFINLIKSLLPFILLPILTSYLTKEEYGVLSLIEVIILFIVPFVLINVHGAIKVEFFKISKDDFRDYFSTAIFISFINFIFFSILVFFFSDRISSLFNIPKNIVLLLPLFAFLRIIPMIISTIFQIFNYPIKLAYFTIFHTFLELSISFILVVKYNLNYIGRIEGIYVSFLIVSIIGIVFLYQMDLFGRIKLKKYLSMILKFGLPLIPHALGAVIINMSDRLFIKYFENDEALVGIYTVSYQVSAILLLVGMSVNQAWSPYLFKLLQKNTEIKKISSYIKYLIMFIILVTVSIYLLSDLLFYFLVDEKFYSAKEYFPYLLFGFMFQALYFIYSNLIFYKKKTFLIAINTISVSLLNIVLNYILIQKFSVLGVAYATLISWFFYFILIYFQIKLNSKYYLKD